MRLCKMLFAALSAAALLGTMAGSATARNFSVLEASSTATFPRVEFAGGFGTVRCNLTLGARLHSRTFAKVLESLAGLITAATVGGCEAGSATILRETLPWHMRYNGFSGTLPEISSIATNVIGFSFRIREPFGVEFLGTSTASNPWKWFKNLVRRVFSQVRVSGTVQCGPFTCTIGGTSNAVAPATTVNLI
jgi:hypothetical protein